MKHNVNEKLIDFLAPMSELHLDPANVNEGHDVSGIAASLEEFTQLTLLVVNERGLIEKGNGTYQAAQSLGWTHIGAVWVGHDPVTGTRYSISDNRLGKKSRFNMESLRKLVGSLNEPETIPGADEDWLELVRDASEEEMPPVEDVAPRVDKAAELQEVWQTKLGQIWQLGEHRLAVGDCQDQELLIMLLDGDSPRYGMHDPPYGIDVVGPAAAIGGSKGFGSVGASGATAVNVYAPIVGDDTPFDPAYLLSVCPDNILWGANYYADKLPPKKGWIVWDKKGRDDWRDTFSDCELAWTSLPTVTRLYHHVWMGMVQEGEREKRVHPTQKPAALFERIMRDLFKDDGIVIDFYAGSGPTLIACERLGRPSRLVEIVPDYAAVIIQRWVDATDKTPELIGNV